MIRFMSAGESHGECLMAIVEGLPAGLAVDPADINSELSRRRQGYGRGERMSIEEDSAEILSGVKNGRTIGSPVALLVKNKDASINELPPVFAPRPGHADLPGALKYGFTDVRCVLERASARETAARVAAGALCKILLRELKIRLESRVLSIGTASAPAGMKQAVERARRQKDTVGGIFEVIARGVPAGLGSYAHYDRRLDARLALAVMSIPGIKGVEFGLGFAAARRCGSQAHDEIFYAPGRGFYRRTNHAGGIEGGVSNGEPVIIRAAMKPIPTLQRPLSSVHLKSKKRVLASVQRADAAAVEAAGVVAEAMAALILADACLERFGADQLRQIKKTHGFLNRKMR